MKIHQFLLGTLGTAALLALTACGNKEATAPQTVTASAPATMAASSVAPAASVATTAAPAENALGKATYGKTCSMCHAANVAGAPKPGDKADWGPRIAQGMDVLYKHAMEGFTGAKGQMPVRGGNTALSDDEVKAGVNFMADQSR